MILEFPNLPSRKPFLIDLVHKDHLYTSEQGGKACEQVGNHTHLSRSGWESILEKAVQKEGAAPFKFPGGPGQLV